MTLGGRLYIGFKYVYKCVCVELEHFLGSSLGCGLHLQNGLGVVGSRGVFLIVERRVDSHYQDLQMI